MRYQFYKVTYLGETMYFDTFSEVKKYYDIKAKSLEELNDKLYRLYMGMEYPEIVKIKF